MIEHIPVSVKDDFLARQTKADPIHALSELIWNSLDAEASSVQVEFEFKDLSGAMSKIYVIDNGNGFARNDAKEQFGNLGGSWKRQTPITPNKKRHVHGQEGRGRYKAFALGGAVEWKVVSIDKGVPHSYSILLLESNLKQVDLGDELPAPGKSSGVIVEIRDIKRDFQVFTSESGLQELAEIFALYLTNYRDARIEVAGKKIDPAKAIENHATYELPSVFAESGAKISFSLDIVEWKGDAKRCIYLCNADGFPLSQSPTRLSVGDFSFSAYIKSPYIMELYNQQRLDLAEMDVVLKSAIDTAKSKIREHFRNRAAARAKSVVDVWKQEEIYPFHGEPASVIENAERQVFDILAVSMNNYAPEFDKADKKTKALNLRMLKEILDPQIVIDEPVKIEGKKTGIVDLMFSTASRRHRPDDIEHLVVELKAPSVKVGAKEISQIEGYAFAVNGDERFKGVSGVRWHFWAISDELDDFAHQKIDGGPNRRDKLTHQSDRIRVGVKTWGELIEENKARLQFFQEHLQYTASEDDGLRYLQERHKEYLEGVIKDDALTDETADLAEAEL